MGGGGGEVGWWECLYTNTFLETGRFFQNTFVHLINKTTVSDVSKQYFFLFAAFMSSADNILIFVQSFFGFVLQANNIKKHFDYIYI